MTAQRKDELLDRKHMRETTATGGKVRVLLFIDNFDVGGTQNQFIQLANALADDPKFDLHVGCLKRRGDLLHALRLSRERVTAYPLQRFYDAKGLTQVVRLGGSIARLGFDIVHAHDFYSNIICAAAGCVSSSRLIVSRRYQSLSSRRIHVIGERWSYRLADAVVLNSRRVANALIDEGFLAGSKATVISNGIALKRFADFREDNPEGPLTAGRRPRMGIVASLCRDKDHETLLHAAARLRARWPGLELILVGEGDQRESLERLVASLGLQQTVTFAGQQEDVRPWLSTLDVAVLSSRREGLPNALLEYMAMGRPVVATAVGAIPEVVEHGKEGLLVPPGDADRLAAAVEELLASEHLRTAIGAAGRRKVQRYGAAQMISAYRQLYDRLLKSPKPAPFSRPLTAMMEATRVRALR